MNAKAFIKATMKKRCLALALVGIMCMGMTAEVFAAEKTAGVCFYSYGDTFTANARQSLENIAEKDGTIEVKSADDQGDGSVQTSNVSNFLTQDVDYLCLTNILPNITSDIAKQVTDAGKTMIFFGCGSPSDEDFSNYENLWFVGSYAEESGTNMGNAVVEYWNSHPEADRNGNGKLDYVMLLGVQGSDDSEKRATNSLKAVTDAGIEVNNLSGDQICDFSRATAQEKVAALLANYGDDIDCVFAVNDDMALGAIQALKAAGFFTDDSNYIPVTGVDATEVGCDAIRDGSLLVTSLNNPVLMGKSLYKLMYLLNNGEEVTTESLGIDGVEVEGHKLVLHYTPITSDNVDDAKYDITDTDF